MRIPRLPWYTFIFCRHSPLLSAQSSSSIETKNICPCRYEMGSPDKSTLVDDSLPIGMCYTMLRTRKLQSANKSDALIRNLLSLISSWNWTGWVNSIMGLLGPKRLFSISYQGSEVFGSDSRYRIRKVKLSPCFAYFNWESMKLKSLIWIYFWRYSALVDFRHSFLFISM